MHSIQVRLLPLAAVLSIVALIFAGARLDSICR
jgi:hypothetical protein